MEEPTPFRVAVTDRCVKESGIAVSRPVQRLFELAGMAEFLPDPRSDLGEAGSDESRRSPSREPAAPRR